jgi:hypothetical protein
MKIFQQFLEDHDNGFLVSDLAQMQGVRFVTVIKNRQMPERRSK